MNKSEILEIAAKCDNALIVVFSETSETSNWLFEDFAKITPESAINWGRRVIRFDNGSQIRFSHSLNSQPYDNNDDICGLEIALAVMNNVEPTIYLRTRVRVGICKGYESFGLPKIVNYDRHSTQSSI